MKKIGLKLKYAFKKSSDVKNTNEIHGKVLAEVMRKDAAVVNIFSKGSKRIFSK